MNQNQVGFNQGKFEVIEQLEEEIFSLKVVSCSGFAPKHL